MVATEHEVDLVDDDTVSNLARAALFAVLMGAFAYVSFPYPLSPIPITLQVLGVFLAGLFLGATWGSFAMIVYLVAGVMGAPIFAFGTAGLGVLFGESGGFLLSFPIAAALIGFVAHGGITAQHPRDIHLVRLVTAMVVGVIVIYGIGVTGMMIVLQLSLPEAVVLGALAFLPAEVAKMLAAIGIVRAERLAAV